MIQLKDVWFAYDSQPVIRGLDLGVKGGELHCIIGPNGAGKSTLLRIIAGLIRPLNGKVMLNQNDPWLLEPQKRAKIVSLVFQEAFSAMPFTVQEIVLMGRHPHQNSFMFDTAEDLEIADQAMKDMDVMDLRRRPFHKISGGERQRVRIAAALAQRTSIMLLDEPTAHSDMRHQVEFYRLFLEITRRRGLTSVVVTHDMNMASLFCSRMSVIEHGRILCCGVPAEVLREDLLHHVYGNAVCMVEHPELKTPMILPLRGAGENV